MQELVSIITPLYNSEKYIGETIESVLKQTYENWEMIVIDDCSTDKGVGIVEDYIKRDDRIKLIRLKKKSGPAAARNKGIKEARGRFIAFIDSDDLWDKHKLEKQISFMKNNNIALSFTGRQIIHEEGKKGKYIGVPEKVNYQDILKHCYIACSTAIYDSEKIGKIYMPDIVLHQDLGLWVKILKQIKYAYGIDKKLGYYRVRKNQISGNKFKSLKYQWIFYRKIEKLNIFKSIIYITNYSFYGLIKYIKKIL